MFGRVSDLAQAASRLRGVQPKALRKARLKCAASENPCAKAASVTLEQRPCIRAWRLACNRSCHTRPMGVWLRRAKARVTVRGETLCCCASHCSDSSGEGFPGIRLQAFFDAFPGRSHVASICGTSYRPALSDIATLVASRLAPL